MEGVGYVEGVGKRKVRASVRSCTAVTERGAADYRGENCEARESRV
jgi:hypothetical protein